MFRYAFLVLASLILSLASPAQASIIDFPDGGFDINMGTVQAGQHGRITSEGDFSNFDTLILMEGDMPTNTKITFSYTSNVPFDVINAGWPEFMSTCIRAEGKYSGRIGNVEYYGEARHTNDYNDANSDTQIVDSRALVFAAANFTDSQHAVMEIVNKSPLTAHFQSIILQYGRNSGLITYNVSAVPLPAALPLFGAGLLGLVGIRKSRKGRKSRHAG